MKKFAIAIFLCVLPVLHGQDWYAQWDRSGATWYEKWNNTLDIIGNRPATEQIEILGAAVRTARQIDSPEKLEIFKRSQTALLAIPGHATYYGDRINKAQAERRAAVSVGAATESEPGVPNYGSKDGEFRNAETDGLGTLRYLPSPETINVLGEFLSDEWVSPRPVQDDWLWPSLARHSSEMLAVMPIVNKPTARIEDPTNPGIFIPDVKAWQQWFEQIKAGKRTFRFEGDSTEYTLAGPATQETLQRIERDRKRDEERKAGDRRSRSVSDFVSQSLNLSKPSSIAGILAACGLCVTAVWYFLRGRGTV